MDTLSLNLSADVIPLVERHARAAGMAPHAWVETLIRRYAPAPDWEETLHPSVQELIGSASAEAGEDVKEAYRRHAARPVSRAGLRR